jgi:hypothetical protein
VKNTQNISAKSDAVIAHINNMQAIITRMANSSNECKKWCVTLVSAILVLISDKGQPNLIIIAIIPIIIFLFLDTYYLALERSFRGGYNVMLEKIHQQTFGLNDLYQVKPDNKLLKHFLLSLLSHSIYPFYIGMLVFIALTKYLILD